MKEEKQKIIFHINTIANSGSTGRILEGICKLVKAKNNTICYTAYGRWANNSETILYKIGNSLSIYWHVFITRFLDKHGLASTYATKKLVKKIKKIKPDILHLHNIHGYYLNYPVLFAYLSKINIPIIWTLHDCWPYTGHCVHYTEKKCYKWRTGCFNCPNKKDYPHSWLVDSSKSNYKKKKYYFTLPKKLVITTVSNWLAEQVKESFLSKYPIINIYNGINVDIFSPQKIEKSTYGWDNKFIILGVATKWNKRKGLDDFIQLANILDSNDLIVLIGLSKKQINNLPKNIIGLEKTENVQELVKLYSISDVYINFSIEETFGLTTIESLSCGTPAIVVNSTASPEIINEDVGFVVEPHDIQSVKNHIFEIKKKGKDFYTEKCHAYVKENFNEVDKYKEYINLYDTFLNNENISNNDYV